MRIFIPTLGRVASQKTWDNLTYDLQLQAQLVVYPEEADAHRSLGRTVLVSKQKQRGIAHKRNFIVNYCVNTGIDKFCMLDDDLEFYVRGVKRDPESSTPFSLYAPSPVSLENMFNTISNVLNKDPACTVSPREGCNRLTDKFHYNMRSMRVLAYHTPTLVKVGFDFAKTEMMEDFAMSLKLHTNGYRMCTITKWAQGQSGSNTEGGCSITRTQERQEKCCNDLKTLFPEYVTIVTKANKWLFNGVQSTRSDVRVKWAKAYKDGVAMHGKQFV